MAEPKRKKEVPARQSSGRSESSKKPKPTKRHSKAKPRKSGKGKSRQPSKALPDYKMIKALGHPLRVEILTILAEGVASPKEIAEELNEGIAQVSYHVKVLRDARLIVDDHSVQRRGAVAHFYRAAVPTLIPPDAWDNLPDAVRKGISAHILKEFLDDALASMEEGVFDDSPGELSWTPLILDQIGVEEIGQLSRDFLKSLLAVQAKASERLPKKKAKRAAEARSVTVFLASFLSSRDPKDDKKASSMKRR
jgi:DNA-binding transcriptional ArsR family regulator